MSESRLPQEPFVGPRPIGAGELIFGRDAELATLAALLTSRRLLLLHAPSGAGKTSLINAGLTPLLAEDEFHLAPVIRINREPPVLDPDAPPLNRYLLSVIASLEEAFDAPERLPESALGGLSLDAYLRGYLERRGLPADTSMVLIFDQFEEIITVNPIDVAVKEQCFAELGRALADRSRWALFVIRDDYVGALDPYLRPLPTQLSARMRLDLLSEEAAQKAIVRPPQPDQPQAATYLNTFTAQAARRLASDLCSVRIPQPDGSEIRGVGFVEPVQLQVVCQRLWERRAPGVTQIVEAMVEATGNVDEALAGYYDDCLTRILAGARQEGWAAREWQIREWFDRQLITAQNIRSQVMQGLSESGGLDNRVVARLIDAYLVREERRRGVVWYELAHDRLVRPIRESNERWRRDHLSPFHEQARRWADNGRPRDLLLGASELEVLERWELAHPDALTPVEEEFLDASQAQRRAAQTRAAHRFERRINLDETGWAAIFPENGDPNVRKALAELLEHRRAEAAQRRPELFRLLAFHGAAEGRAAETAAQFLARHGVGVGTIEPEKMPYYLLIVGGPESIPFEFQYALDLQYAVGRIAFDTLEEYAAYARSVVTAERGGVSLPRRAVIFSPRHAGDPVTGTIAQALVPQLRQQLEQAPLDPAWQVETIADADASRARLGALLGGPNTPALLFLTGRGLDLPATDARRPAYQGSLLCQDWPGPATEPTPAQAFTAEDVPAGAGLLGSVVLLAASYSVGVAAGDDYAHLGGSADAAGEAFITRLAARLLGHPRGGVLAVCGHVDRTFLEEAGVPDARVFGDAARRLMDGHSVGSAVEVFDQRYAVFAARVGELLRARGSGGGDREQTALLTAMVDARNNIILGDPAARLPLAARQGELARPAIAPVELRGPVARPVVPNPASRTTRSVEPASVPAAEVIERYADLEIGLRRGVSSHNVEMRLSLPFADQELRLCEDESVRFDLERLDALEPSAREYGALLTASLFERPTVLTSFQRARASAEAQGTPLRLRLTIHPSAQELQALRWERLLDPIFDQPLAVSLRTVISRYLVSEDWRPVLLRPQGALSSLAVVASPRDHENYALAPIDVAAELARARQFLPGAVATLGGGKAAELEGIAEALRDGVDLLYLLCRARMVDGGPVLYLERADGSTAPTYGRALAERIGALANPPRLVVLCAGGHDDRALTALALQLIQAGVPAVLAMEAPISPESCIAFLGVFFRELQRDGVVDRAVTAARAAIGERPDWWAPVLLMRLRSGRLWAGPGSPASAQLPTPAPFQAPELYPEYVSRPALEEQVRAALLAASSTYGATVVALHGAPGVGKSSLAAAVCRDASVRAAFADGVLWQKLGERPNLQRILTAWVQLISGERSRAVTLEEARAEWRQLSAGRSLLVVLVDVWHQANLTDLLPAGERCAAIVTGRDRRAVAPHASLLIQVDKMTAVEGLALLATGLPDEPRSGLTSLLQRLGRSPLALRLANQLLHLRVQAGQSLGEAVAHLQRNIDRKGLAALEVRTTDDFGATLRGSLAQTLARLAPPERARLAELIVFPEGEPVPARVVRTLWAATWQLDAEQTDEELARLGELALVEIDTEREELLLQGLLRGFLAQEQGDGESERIHARLLDAFQQRLGLSHWAQLPPGELYLWRNLANHLVGAGRKDELRALLLDITWMNAALVAGGVELLRRACDSYPDGDLELLNETLRLATPALAADARQLPAQLCGRLGAPGTRELKALERAARAWQGGVWLAPRTAALTPPGGPLEIGWLAEGVEPSVVLASADGQRVAVGDAAGSITWWDGEQGLPLTAARLHSGRVSGMALASGPATLSYGGGARLRLWAPDSPEPPATITFHAGAVSAIAPLPTGDAALVGTRTGGLRLLALPGGEERLAFAGHQSAILALAVNQQGTQALSASAYSMRLWDLASGAELYRIDARQRVSAVALGPDEQQIFVGTQDGIIAVWDPRSGLVQTAPAHSGPVVSLGMATDRRVLVSAGVDGAVRVWGTRRGLSPLRTFQAHAGPLNALSLTPDGLRALSVGADRAVRRWRLDRPGPTESAARQGAIVALCFSGDAKELRFVVSDSSVGTWQLDGSTTTLLPPLAGDASVASLAPDGAVAILGQEGLYTAKGFTVRGRRFENPARRPLGLDTRLIFAPDGQLLVGAPGQGLFIWDPASRKVIEQRREAATGLTSLAVTSDSAWMVAGYADGRVAVWGMAPAKGPRFELSGHAGPVTALALTAEEDIVSAGADGILLWDWVSRQPRRIAPASGPIGQLSATPDGRLLASAGGDGVVRLWDLRRAELLAAFQADYRITSLQINPAGTLIAAGDEGGRLHLLEPRGL